jgi:hypothetical protein
LREEIKIRLIEISQTIVGTVSILGLLAFILFVAYAYFHGWGILAAIAVELALLVFVYHVYRWFRYPGLFQSKSAIQLFSQVLLSILFIYSIPLIAILARLHIARFLPLEKVGWKLGLEFKFKMREVVRTSTDAPTHPGEIGRITKIRVAAEDSSALMPLQIGEVIYQVRSAEESFEISERYLFAAR